MSLGRIKTLVSSASFLLQGIQLKGREAVTLSKITLRYKGIAEASGHPAVLSRPCWFCLSSPLHLSSVWTWRRLWLEQLCQLCRPPAKVSAAKARRQTLFWCLLFPGVFRSPYVCAYALVYSDWTFPLTVGAF